ncbi:hypothetical protein ACWCWD_28995 [Streptomyces sp. NPDC001493]
MENDNTDDGTPQRRPDRDPQERRPWSPEQGSRPRVTAYPAGRRPGMYVWDGSSWIHCSVEARYDWPDGHITYTVSGALAGGPGSIVTRTYVWPHGMQPVVPPGPAHEADAQDEDEGEDAGGE